MKMATLRMLSMDSGEPTANKMAAFSSLLKKL